MQVTNLNVHNNKKLYNTSFQSKPPKILTKPRKDLIEKSLACLSTVGLGKVLINNDELDKFLNEKKEIYSEDEISIIKDVGKKNPKLTKYLLTSLLENGLGLRFDVAILGEDIIFETDPELVKKLVEMKITKVDYRFRNDEDLVNILKCYKSNPERTQELIEEKMTEPYEDAYMNPYVDDIKGVLDAEELSKETAERFENMRLPNGLKRFYGREILALTRGYLENSKSTETMVSAKNEDGTPLFLTIPTDIDYFLKVVESFEKCPNIVEFINESPIQFWSLCDSIIQFADAYEKDANYTKELFQKEDSSDCRLYHAQNIKNIVDAHLINHELTEKLLAENDYEGDNYLSPEEILSLVKLKKEDSMLFEEIIVQKDGNGKYRITNDNSILTYKNLKEKYGKDFFELYNKKDDKGNYIFPIYTIEGFIQCYNDFTKEDVDFLVNLKDTNGALKLQDYQIHVLLECVKAHPEKKDELLSLVKKPSVSYDIVYDLQKLVRENDGNYKQAYNLVKKISDFLEERDISPRMYINDNNFEGDIIVNVDSIGNRSFVFDKNGDIKLEKDYEIALEALYEDKITKYIDGRALSSIKFMNYYENNEVGTYPMESIKEFYDTTNNIIYSTYTEKSKDYPTKLNLYSENSSGKIALAETKADINGDLVSTKNFEYNNTKFTQIYRENSKSRKNFIEIVDKQGNVLLDHNIQINVLSDDKFESIENGIKYAIEYFSDKVVVVKDGEVPVEISIGENSIDAEDVISRDLLHLVKQLPGSTLYNLHKYKPQKIWLNENKISKNNAQFNGFVNKIELSEYQSREEKLFVLLHEIGHFLDYHKLRADEELSKIFNEEKEIFKNNSTANEQTALSYLIDSRTITNNSISTEAVAETYAILNSINKSPELELRGLLFQQYFPRTFAKIAELLND